VLDSEEDCDIVGKYLISVYLVSMGKLHTKHLKALNLQDEPAISPVPDKRPLITVCFLSSSSATRASATEMIAPISVLSAILEIFTTPSAIKERKRIRPTISYILETRAA
jgi:hypothetical protein